MCRPGLFLLVLPALTLRLRTFLGDGFGIEHGGHCMNASQHPVPGDFLGIMERTACWRVCALRPRARGCGWTHEGTRCHLHTALVDHGGWYPGYDCLVLRGNILLGVRASTSWSFLGGSGKSFTDGNRITYNPRDGLHSASRRSALKFSFERSEIGYVVVTGKCTTQNGERRQNIEVVVGSTTCVGYVVNCTPMVTPCRAVSDTIFIRGERLRLVEVEAYLHGPDGYPPELVALVPQQLPVGTLTVVADGPRRSSVDIDLQELSIIHLVAIKWDCSKERNFTIFSSDLSSNDSTSTVAVRRTKNDDIAHAPYFDNLWSRIRGWPEVTKRIRLEASEGVRECISPQSETNVSIRELVVLGVPTRAILSPVQRVTSDGTVELPHCAAKSACTARTKLLCAKKLCRVAGYPEAQFVEASNDLCASSYSSEDVYVNVLINGTWRTELYVGSHSKEARISTTCVMPGAQTLTKTLTKLVDCKFSNWSIPGRCTKSCGGGKQLRTRTVVEEALHGGNCSDLTQVLFCNTHDCPVDCKLSNWSIHGSCTKSCGGGEQLRTRTVVGEALHGGNCGNLTHVLPCNAHECPGKLAAAVECQWRNWSSWGSCSQSCGNGMQVRTREMISEANSPMNCVGSNSEAQMCGGVKCPVHGGWGPWSTCEKLCGVGRVYRQCDSPAPQHGGIRCRGPRSQMCFIEACPSITLTSDGSHQLPFCGFFGTRCVWDDATRSECAAKMCEAMYGRRSRSVYVSGSDMCNPIWEDTVRHYWDARSKRYIHGIVLRKTAITAKCQVRYVTPEEHKRNYELIADRYSFAIDPGVLMPVRHRGRSSPRAHEWR